MRQGARCELLRDILGHANIDVTQIVYGESAECVAKFSCKD
jgi:site-specific recombinase XerD